MADLLAQSGSRASSRVRVEAIRAPHPLISIVMLGKYLFLVTLAFIWIAWHLLGQVNESFTRGDLPWISAPLSCFFLTNAVLSFLDGWSRFQNYKRLKDQMYLKGIGTRFLRASTVSRCQREAALVAAGELGVKREVREDFRTRGYRWYHFLPDFVSKHPTYLVDRRFWRHTFFATSYRSKVDFAEIVRKRDSIAADQSGRQEIWGN